MRLPGSLWKLYAVILAVALPLAVCVGLARLWIVVHVLRALGVSR